MCEICKRWRERIRAAAEKKDETLVNLLVKLYHAHKADGRYHV